MFRYRNKYRPYGVLRRDIGGGGSTPPSPLLTDLVAYWKLDEVSGARSDSTANNNDLTDNNTVGSATGIIGNAAQFVTANSEYLSSSSSMLSFTGDFTIALWCNTNDVSGNAQYPLAKDDVSDREYHIQILDGSYNFQVWNGVAKTTLALPATSGVWQHLMMWYDSVAGILYVSVDNGTPGSVALADINNTSTPFLVGVRGDFTGYYDGLIDEIGIWERLLTPAERTQLYNSGAGLTYPF